MSDIKLHLSTNYQLNLDEDDVVYEEEDPGYVEKVEYLYQIDPNDKVLHQFWGENKTALVTLNTEGYSAHFTGPDFYAERRFPGYSEHYVESAAENWTLGVLKKEHFEDWELRVPMPTYATSAIWEEDAV